MIKFSEWIKIKEDCGEPHSPAKMKKIKEKEEISKKTRDGKKDLGSDYVGNLSRMGDCEPFKCLGKGGKSAADVA
jgi:hypothetical protein